jgi:Flp pilus assembly protein TadG
MSTVNRMSEFSAGSGRRGGRLRSELGSLVVEFALVLGLVLVPLMISLVAFSWIMNGYLELNNAVAIGANAVAVSRGSTTDPCLTAEDAIYAAAPILIQSKLTFTFTFIPNTGGSGTPFTGGGKGGSGNAAGCSATGATGATAYVTRGDYIQVQATYAYTTPIHIPYWQWFNNLANSGLQLNAQTADVIQ